MTKQKTVLYDGVFPIGVSVGAVAAIDGIKEVVVNTYHPNGSTDFEFITRPLGKFREQVMGISRNQSVNLGSPRYDDHSWRFNKLSGGYDIIADREASVLEWSAHTKITELPPISGKNNVFKKDRWHILNRRKLTSPGFIVHGYTGEPKRWGGHYLEQSSLWLVNGQLRIVHSTAKNDEITAGISAGPSAPTQRYIDRFFPQAQPT